MARLTDGQTVLIVLNLPTLEQARYIEATIEDHLAIVDDPNEDIGNIPWK